MREINAALITETIARLCVEANRNLPGDVCQALCHAASEEPFAPARDILDILVRNEGRRPYLGRQRPFRPFRRSWFYAFVFPFLFI